MELDYKVYEKTKTTYDNWLFPINLDSVSHITKSSPKNYATIANSEVSDQVYNNFLKKDKDLNNVSQFFKDSLKKQIQNSFFFRNLSDFESGGDGMIVPTFVEIWFSFVFKIKINNQINQFSEVDKKIIMKYFWAYKLKQDILLNEKLRNT